MINPATDCHSDLSPSDLSRMTRYQLETFAQHGNDKQKQCLIDWGYSGLPAWQFEYLYEMATGEPWQQD
jgi:hypothetical protein